MICYKNLEELPEFTRDSVITLGKFDGLHRGHDLLLEQVIRLSNERQWNSVVVTFNVPPRQEIQGEKAKVLTTNEEKRFLLEREGISHYVECIFDQRLRSMEPEDFLALLLPKLRVRAIVVGSDFCFGHNRAGNIKLLKTMENTYGYTTIVIDKMRKDDRDISSTLVRELIGSGQVEKANSLLENPYFIYSKVIHGNQIGRKMGIPTINMQLPPEKLLPPNGVYVTRVWIGDQWYRSVSDVGNKPTIAGQYPVGVETFILDFCQNLYEQDILVEFLCYIRPEKKFDSLELLMEQIHSDIGYTENYYKNVT